MNLRKENMKTAKIARPAAQRMKSLKSSSSMAFIAALLSAIALASAAAEEAVVDEAVVDEAKLSVPVSVLSASPPAASIQVADMREEPAPATPAARMPQYQLHHLDRTDDADPSSSVLRYILAAPGQPLLVETMIIIDGKPFRQIREDRIQEIMKFVADPAAFRAEAERVAAQTRAEAEARATEAENKSFAERIIQSVSSAVSGLLSGDEADRPSGTSAAEDTEPDGCLDESDDKDGNANDAASVETKSEGTESTADAESATEPEPGTDAPTEPEEAKAEEVPVSPKYYAPSTIIDRIDRYMSATRQSPDADEIRWLLTNWVDGPVLLFLNDNFQRFRGDQKPVFRILDRNRDGTISADELTQAVNSFQECDLHRNDIVEATELAEVAEDPRDQAVHASPGKLVFRLPDAGTAAAFYRHLAARYDDAGAENPRLVRFDSDNDGALSENELKQLHEGRPDIQIRVEFNSASPTESRLTVEGFGEAFAGLKESAKRNAASVTLKMDRMHLEFLAVQSGPSDQISIGAVNDGYAMLPELDPNNDGRFSIRELRQLNDRLNTFDVNHDGRITLDEEHPTIRVCIGLGPTAHQPLALLRNTTPPDSEPLQPGPEWFQEMDKNNDNDLTRKEFPGTDEQFALLDKDSDKLISVIEANEFETQR